MGDRLPLARGREGGAAATQEAGRGNLPEDCLRAELERPAERCQAAGGLEARKGGAPTFRPAEEAEGRLAGLRERSRCGVRWRWRISPEESGHQFGGDRSHRDIELVRLSAGAADECRRAALAEAQAGALPPAGAGRPLLAGCPGRALDLLQQACTPRCTAGDVVADVDGERRTWLGGQQVVEGGDPVDLGRRHGQPLREEVDGAPADPANAVLDSVQGGQQQVAAVPVCPAAPDHPLAVRRRRAEHGLDDGALDLGCGAAAGADVHLRRAPRRRSVRLGSPSP